MEAARSLTPEELSGFLRRVAPVRPVFIWGPPGIGKSALVEDFARAAGLECLSLRGTQLSREDLLGAPRIEDGVLRFSPPALIARRDPYCLYLDELNDSSKDVQRAFYSLINSRRVGEFRLPEGTVVIGAGYRGSEVAEDAHPLASGLINRMAHVQLRVTAESWLAWAEKAGIHPLVKDYITLRSDHLWSKPSVREEPFSSPRAWHILSDALKTYGNDNLDEEVVAALASGLVNPPHARQFSAFNRQQLRSRHLAEIFQGKTGWPAAPEERDILFFMVESFRAQLISRLPHDRDELQEDARAFTDSAKRLFLQLSGISLELAQLVVARGDDGTVLPDWFLLELTRDVPRLVAKRSA